MYKNFKALKNAIPEIDAVNNDDEHCYDVATAVKFHQMMYELGYKTTIAPYTNRSFWENLVSQLGDRCDRVLIQCYDGGAGNNPSDWHLGNGAVHARETKKSFNVTADHRFDDHWNLSLSYSHMKDKWQSSCWMEDLEQF